MSRASRSERELYYFYSTSINSECPGTRKFKLLDVLTRACDDNEDIAAFYSACISRQDELASLDIHHSVCLPCAQTKNTCKT